MHLPQWLWQCAPRTAARALVWYLLLTIAFTWPVTAGISRDIPRDLGDPLLNCWILGWNAEHFTRFLLGDWAALGSLWHGNIYYPEPYTLAYSELLIAPAIQILPVYWFTQNLVLCYNLLFLSTFALSGLGMFVLVRAYTNDWRAAFIAGLLFAFTPYRINQSPHLQVMSSQWMPFALYGFHRFVVTGHMRAAIGGALALVAQNLSCGYFLIYFTLFIPPFVLFEIWRTDTWMRVRTWTGLAVAALLVAVATLPTMYPYLALRDLHGPKRSREEIQIYSADALGWLAADDQLAFWGPRLRVFVKPEGQIFPGALPVLLAGLAIGAAIRREWKRAAPPSGSRSLARRWVTVAASALILAALVLSLLVIFGLRQSIMAWIPAQIVRFENLLIVLAVGFGILCWSSKRVRAVAHAALRSPLAFVALCTSLAWYLSLGPVPSSNGFPIHGPRLYAFFLEHVPGVDGLRVPARFAMIVVCFLSLAAAWGVRRLLEQRTPDIAAAIVVLLASVSLAETWCAPLPMNGVMGSGIEGIGDPPARVPVGGSPPPLARFIRQLPGNAILLELPFGAGGWEMRAMYFSTLHWRPIVNGFSGYAPESYTTREKALRDPLADPSTAWQQILDSGATYIVVHGQAYVGRNPPAPYDWLEKSGARFVTRIGTDEIYSVPR